VRLAAADGLARVGTARAIPVLRAAPNSSDTLGRSVESAASAAIHEIAKRLTPSQPRPALPPPPRVRNAQATLAFRKTQQALSAALLAIGAGRHARVQLAAGPWISALRRPHPHCCGAITRGPWILWQQALLHRRETTFVRWTIPAPCRSQPVRSVPSVMGRPVCGSACALDPPARRGHWLWRRWSVGCCRS